MSTSTILVIEDNLADVALFQYLLGKQGGDYRLEILSDGAAALQFVQEHRSGVRKPEPCVIVLDLQLPKYDGVEVLKAIREAPVLAHIQVVVLTSAASPRTLAEVRELGAIIRIKPSGLSQSEELLMEILEICNGKKPAAV